MRRKVVLFFGVVVLWGFGIQDVDARASRVNQLPNGSVFGCGNCHTNSSGGGPRNAFGNAVPLSGSGGGASVQWSATFAALDSDGDGFTNGTELGDPDGDGNAAAGATVTNPGDASSFPQVVNAAPTLAAIDPQAVLEGETLSFEVSGSDGDGDTLTLSAAGLPDGATFEDDTFSWMPGFDLGGSAVVVTFTVSDGTDEASLPVEITVTEVNRPAVLSSISPSRNRVIAMDGDLLSFVVEAEDPDGDAVTLAWSLNSVADAETSGTFAVTVPSGAQDETVSVVVTSADGSEVTQTWTIAKMLVGDFDGGGDVGFNDFLLFVAQFGKTSADVDFDATFDLDADGAVGFLDFLRFAEFFGLSA
jgi:hypothetical protein